MKTSLSPRFAGGVLTALLLLGAMWPWWRSYVAADLDGGS